MATKVVVNSTAGQAVLRGDGIRVFGMDAELELKAQSKRDPRYEKDLGKWIESATGLTLEFQDDLIESLRSGIVLCTLINALLPETIKKINMRPIPLMQVENIGLYLKACWQVGVPSSDLFVTSDLYQKKGVIAVLQNLASVARASHHCPAYKGPTFGVKPPTIQPAKKWDEIKFNQPLLVTDMEDNSGFSSNGGSANTSMTNFCVSCGTKKACIKCDNIHDTETIDKLEKEKQELNEKINQLIKESFNNSNSSVKENEVLSNKVDKLNQVVREQTDKLQSVNDSIDNQRKQYQLKEVELKVLIDKQKLLIDQKESEISSLRRASSLAASPDTRVGPFVSSPPLPTFTNNNSSNSTASGYKPRNSGHFNQPLQTTGVSTTTTVTKPTNTFGGVVVVTGNECLSCKFNNSKVSKFCISCGKELPKPISSTVSSISSTSSSSTTTTTTVVNGQPQQQPTQQQCMDSVWYKSLNQEKEELSDRIKSMLASIKQHEDTINKLTKSLSEEKDVQDKRLRDQKQTIEQQIRQLEQKDREIKQLQQSNQPSPPLSSSPPNTPTYAGSLQQNGEKRFTVQVNSGLRSVQVGPGTYRDRSESQPIQSTNTTSGLVSKITNNYNNISSNNNITSTTSTPTTPNNNNFNLNNNAKEIDRLENYIKMLEKQVDDEKNKNKLKDAQITTLEQKLQTFQTRPRRLHHQMQQPPAQQQQQQQHHIIVGRKRFNTLTADTLDNRLVEDTYKCVNNILFSRAVEFYEVSALNALFKSEQGRRRFSQILQVTLKQVRNIVLSDSSFEFLLYLINTTLQEMDVSKDTDIMTAKVILHASSSLYRVTNTGEEYIKDFIRSSPVWRNMGLWEVYFWEQLAKRHRKRYDNSVERIDSEIVSNLLSYFGVTMVHFQVDQDDIKAFIVDMAKANGLTNPEANIIIDFLKQSSSPPNQNHKVQAQKQSSSKSRK